MREIASMFAQNPVVSISQDVAHRWIERWDSQQERYIAAREARFDIMLQAVETLTGPAPSILDLGCGPGSLGNRFAERLPASRILGLDYDPVLLALAEAAHARDPRRSWASADLRGPHWSEILGDRRFDAIVSTTALHWLGADELLRLYRQCASLLRPGGLLLNGDHFTPERHETALARLAEHESSRRFAATLDALDWSSWWSALRLEQSALEPAFTERQERYANRLAEEQISLSFHLTALRQAGFESAEILWQHLDHAVILGLAPETPISMEYPCQ